MKFLKSVLLSNALFSFLSGLGLVVFHATISQWFGLSAIAPFWIIGTVLLLFSIIVFLTSRNPTSRMVSFIILQDLIWVMASLVILLIQPFGISPTGLIIIAAVAVVVLFFAIGQYMGLASIKKQNESLNTA